MSSPGFFFASAISSLTVFTGSDGWTASALSPKPIIATGAIDDVKHRTFGRSGIKVSEIIFGAGAVGGIVIHKDDATKREAIRRALAGGINWIDTAAQYGNGKSEEALGWLLPEAGERRPISRPSSVSMWRI